jgi:hypothetical protein
MAARAFRILGFWHEADEPPTRGSGGGGAGGSCRASARTLGPTNECYWGPPRVILLFLERSFEPPAQLMLAQPERGGR